MYNLCTIYGHKWWFRLSMQRSIADHNPYNMFILTIDFSKNSTKIKLLTIEHMAMFVVKSIVIQINGKVYGLINNYCNYKNNSIYTIENNMVTQNNENILCSRSRWQDQYLLIQPVVESVHFVAGLVGQLQFSPSRSAKLAAIVADNDVCWSTSLWSEWKGNWYSIELHVSLRHEINLV